MLIHIFIKYHDSKHNMYYINILLFLFSHIVASYEEYQLTS